MNKILLNGTIGLGSLDEQNILDMYSQQTGKPANYLQYKFGIPSKNTDLVPDSNTVVNLTRKQNGAVTELHYNRLHVSTLGTVKVSKGTDTTIFSVLNKINTKYNISLSTADVVDATLPSADGNGDVVVNLVLTGNSLTFYDGAVITPVSNPGGTGGTGGVSSSELSSAVAAGVAAATAAAAVNTAAAIAALPSNSGAVSTVAGKSGAVVLTNSDVGLSNVDNTSDAAKPVSTAQAAANTATLTAAQTFATNADTTVLNSAKAFATAGDSTNLITAKAYTDSVSNSLHTTITSEVATTVASKQDAATAVSLNSAQTLTNKTLTAPVISSPSGITKSDVGLTNVDNTSDVNKPVSTAQAAAITAANTTTNAQISSWAGNLDSLIKGTITRDANGAATGASVVWPDTATGVYAATTVSNAFPGAVDAYTVTHVLGGVTKTATQSAVTRDVNGAVTARPAIGVA